MRVQRQKTPQIKVCGVTLPSDVDFLAQAGVDTIGLNFVPSSPRCVSAELGQELSRRAADLGLRTVAVVMDCSAANLDALLATVEVDMVQLHGRERPELATACRGLPIIKATSWSGRPEEVELVNLWRPLAKSGTLIALLVDAYAPTAGGGTGKTARWDLLQPRPPELMGIPLILAGGLTAENVAAAVAATQPAGVDTASGVELRPGVKSQEKVLAFVKNLREQRKTLPASDRIPLE